VRRHWSRFRIGPRQTVSAVPYTVFEAGDESIEGDLDARRAQYLSLRDELRAARRWQELLTPADRQRLLADIARVSIAIGRDLHPDHRIDDLDIGDRAGHDACPRERLGYLEAAWPRLSAALRRIESVPLTALVGEDLTTSVERGSVRRVVPGAVLAAIRTGDLFALDPSKAQLPLLAIRLGGRLPRRIVQRIATPTTKTPENLAVKSVLIGLVQDIRAIADLAVQANATDIARRAEALLRSVRRRLNADPWRSLPVVAGAPIRTAAPVTLPPSYRFVFETWRRYRGAFGFDWASPLFHLPARETWQLYEIWCLFAVADALRSLGFRTSHPSDSFALTRAGLTLSLTRGRPLRLTFAAGRRERISLTYSPTFSRVDDSNRQGWHSLSHTLTPDIVVEVGGSALILDAKFKTYTDPGALLPDIQQMHTYRDAIRRAGSPGAVRSAWLLYAGARGVHEPRVTGYPHATAELPFGNGEIGALRLRPDDRTSILPRLLTIFLEERQIDGESLSRFAE